LGLESEASASLWNPVEDQVNLKVDTPIISESHLEGKVGLRIGMITGDDRALPLHFSGNFERRGRPPCRPGIVECNNLLLQLQKQVFALLLTR